MESHLKRQCHPTLGHRKTTLERSLLSKFTNWCPSNHLTYTHSTQTRPCCQHEWNFHSESDERRVTRITSLATRRRYSIPPPKLLGSINPHSQDVWLIPVLNQLIPLAIVLEFSDGGFHIAQDRVTFCYGIAPLRTKQWGSEAIVRNSF